MAFKAISTLDSMIGHPEAPYTFFGRVAARLDDAANFIPARLTAILITLTARRDAPRVWRVWKRDGSLHRSPNAGQCEASMAGALGVRLGGKNRYAGIVYDTPKLGEELRIPRISDIREAMRCTLAASLAALPIAMLAQRIIAKSLR
jgi:adenosylcobinamide-phosphate synthase